MAVAACAIAADIERFTRNTQELWPVSGHFLCKFSGDSLLALVPLADDVNVFELDHTSKLIRRSIQQIERRVFNTITKRSGHPYSNNVNNTILVGPFDLRVDTITIRFDTRTKMEKDYGFVRFWDSETQAAW